MVADMVAHVNTGFMTRLQNEVYGNERLFGSCFYSDSTKHPSLTIKYFPPTGVSDPNAEKVVYIYPNPAKNLLSARLAGFDNIPVTVSIYDLLGNVVYKQVFANGGDHLSIPVQQMTSGIYIFEALSERAEIRQKFIKE